MPIYEYDCLACGEAFEKLVLTQMRAATMVCPACGSAEVARALSVFGVNVAPGAAGAPRAASGGGGCGGPGGCGCR